MTIAVSVKVGEGLVMAADSTSSFFSGDVLAQSYHHARKLLQLKDYPIGILTFGLGNIAGRNLERCAGADPRSGSRGERSVPTHLGTAA